jgi:hypothetical protein
MLTDLKNPELCRPVHASNLGAFIAHSIDRQYDIPACIVDPVTVDESEDIARISGHPKIERKSLFHALNIRYILRQLTSKIEKKMSQCNMVAAHIGGGISVAPIKQVKVVDVNNNAVWGRWPFSPQRCGAWLRRLFLVLILIFIISGCTFSTSPTTPTEWTILVYMAADNGLNNNAIEDIEQMKEANFSDEVNVIVQVDYNEDSNYEGAKRYQIFPGAANELAKLGEIDSGSYTTLANFINWGTDRFPAHNYALFLWGHGNGWYNHNLETVFMPDHQANSYFNIPAGDLRNALRLSYQKMDIIAFDACNMFTMEVLAEVAPYTNFIVGSEDTVPQQGFPYDKILTNWENYIQPANIVVDITNCYVNSYLPFGSQNLDGSYLGTIAIAAANSANFQNLETKIEQFIQQNPYFAAESVFQQARDNCEYEFNDLQVDIDVKEFFHNLAASWQEHPPLLNDILNQIAATFIAQQYLQFPDDFSNQIGSAVLWLPDKTHQYVYTDLVIQYRNLLFDVETNWSDFIAEFYD